MAYFFVDAFRKLNGIPVVKVIERDMGDHGACKIQI
jgi:hypothetical protein